MAAPPLSVAAVFNVKDKDGTKEITEQITYSMYSLLPENAKAVQGIGTAPEMDSDVVDEAGVPRNVLQSLVQGVSHHVGQCEPCREQKSGHDRQCHQHALRPGPNPLHET